MVAQRLRNPAMNRLRVSWRVASEWSSAIDGAVFGSGRAECGGGLTARSGTAPRTTTRADGTARIFPFVSSGPTAGAGSCAWLAWATDPPAAAIAGTGGTRASLGRDSWKYGTAGASSSRRTGGAGTASGGRGAGAAGLPGTRGVANERSVEYCAATTGVICLASSLTISSVSGVMRSPAPGSISAVRTPTMSPSRSIGTAIAARRLPLRGRVRTLRSRPAMAVSTRDSIGRGPRRDRNASLYPNPASTSSSRPPWPIPQTTMPLAPMRRDAGSSRAPSAASDDVPRSAVDRASSARVPCRTSATDTEGGETGGAHSVRLVLEEVAGAPRRRPTGGDAGRRSLQNISAIARGTTARMATMGATWPLPDVTLNLSAATNASRV